MRLWTALFVSLLAGCTKTVAVTTAPPLDVYSVYTNKVAGKWFVSVETSGLTTSVSFPSEVCSLYDFPVDLTSVVRDSALGSFHNVAEDARKADATATAKSLEGANGIVRLRVGNLQTRVHPLKQGWNAFDVEITIDAAMTVESGGKQILDAAATGSGEAQNNAGTLCDKADALVSKAATEAIRQAMRLLAEKFANAPQIREARAAAQ